MRKKKAIHVAQRIALAYTERLSQSSQRTVGCERVKRVKSPRS